jgi:hypothetical protein
MRLARPTPKKNLGSADAQTHQQGPAFAILLSTVDAYRYRAEEAKKFGKAKPRRLGARDSSTRGYPMATFSRAQRG